jgi:CRP/FNR family transcriptional regulator, anaerobic regulatory protein
MLDDDFVSAGFLSVSGRSSGSAAGRRPGGACLVCLGRSVGLCRDFDQAGLKPIFSESSRQTLASGQPLSRQGENSRFVDTVVSGSLVISRILRDGRRFVFGFALPGEFVGFLAKDSGCYSAVAMEPTEVCRYPLGALQEFIALSPRLSRNLFMRVDHERSRALDHVILLGCGRATQRIAVFLLRLQARQRHAGSVSPRIDLPMRRVDIADHLGLTVETVSRTFQLLARKAIIVVIPGGVRVLSQWRLAQLADTDAHNIGPMTGASLSGGVDDKELRYLQIRRPTNAPIAAG